MIKGEMIMILSFASSISRTQRHCVRRFRLLRLRAHISPREVLLVVPPEIEPVMPEVASERQRLIRNAISSFSI